MMFVVGRDGALASLLLWDAPCLPLPEQRRTAGEPPAKGEVLVRLAKAPLGVRAAVALQLISAAEFLLAQGWYPERRLLRGARVEWEGDTPAVRLPALPRWRLEDRIFRTPAGQRLLGLDALAARLVLPLLVTLLPERRTELAAAAAKALPGEASLGLATVVGGCGRRGAYLKHRQGAGRSLWARRFHLPEEGVVWVEEAELLPRLEAAAALECRAGLRRGRVVSGRLDEGEVAKAQARSAAGGEPLLVLTTLPVTPPAPLTIVGDEGAVWVFPGLGPQALAHARQARGHGGGRARVVAEVLSLGARTGFFEPPGGWPEVGGREAWASPAARDALGWLRAAPYGLDSDECGALKITGEALTELLRLGLAEQRKERWFAASPGDLGEEERRGALARVLPQESLAGMVARALRGGSWEPLERWCQTRLETEEGALEVLTLAAALPQGSPLALLGAEAALSLGRLAEASEVLHSLPGGERRGPWYVLQAWWALLAGSPQEALDALTVASGEGIEGRLAARAALVAAELAHQRGDTAEERRFLERAVQQGGHAGEEAALYVAALEGASALRRLRRARWCSWPRALQTRYLHLLGLDAFRRNAACAVGSALRAALRQCAGLNPLTLGELCADLATVHLLQDRPAAAERCYGLAQTYLERAGTRRAAFMVRANRAVVANDLMRWRQAQALLAGAVPPSGEGAALHEAANATELVRCELVRGRLAEVRAALPRLQATVEHHPAWVLLSQAVASLRLHLALAEGDVEAAVRVLGEVEESERALARALLAAQEGVDPDPALSPRWGVVPCAAVLAAWRRGETTVAHWRATRLLDRVPREGAVALARFLRLLARSGERLDSAWDTLLRRAETLLEEADLDGWVAGLRAPIHRDPLALTKALVASLTAGTACTDPAYLESLGRALGVHRLEVWHGEALLGAWGDGEAQDDALAVGDVAVRWGGAVDEVVRVALEGVARLVGAGWQDRRGDATVTASPLVGRSAALARVRELIALWGPLPLPVLITGPPGTGKELVARELHRISGRKGAFLPINCAAVPTSLLERELFGTVRGAFTGAEADQMGLVEAAEGGTLFLDEVGELPGELQAKLLRLLQEREVRRLGSTRLRVVDVRFLAATNRDLEAAVGRGEFRRDLYYRLAAAVIHIPALAERPEDVDELAVLFCERAAREFQRTGVRLSQAALDALRRAPWPGNARELEWAIRRAVVAARPGETLGPKEFGDTVAAPPPPLPSFSAARERFLTEYFTSLLAAAGGNRSLAARRAGLTRQGLLYHLRTLGLSGE